jgi:hypothetical protein
LRDAFVKSRRARLAYFPAVTGATLLCRRADYLSVGGLDEQYCYGYEDVDFCLKISTILGMRVICVNDRYVIHEESTSRYKFDIGVRQARIFANRAILQKRFGYIWRRQMRAALLDNDGSYSGKRFTLGICDQRGCELGEALNTDDWEIVYLDSQAPLPAEGLDVIISTQPETDIRALKDAEPNLIRIGWWSEARSSTTVVK